MSELSLDSLIDAARGLLGPPEDKFVNPEYRRAMVELIAEVMPVSSKRYIDEVLLG